MPLPKPMRLRCDGCQEMFSQTHWKQTRCSDCGKAPRYRHKKPADAGPLPEDVRWSKWLATTLEPLIGTLTASEFNVLYRRLIMAEHKEKAA
jgi:hypothetical protein